MIEHLELGTWKGFPHLSLALQPLTVLVGPNASGKTSVLEALELVCSLNDSGLRGGLAGRLDADAMARLRTRGAPRFRIATTAPGGGRVEFLAPPPDGAGGIYQVNLYRTEGRENGITFPVQDDARRAAFFKERRLLELGQACFIAPDPAVLRQPSYSLATPSLGVHGEHLAPLLANVAGTDRDLLARIERDLQKVVPTAGRIRTPHAIVQGVEPQTVSINGQTSVSLIQKAYSGSSLELEVAGAGYLSADLLSEGTMLALALVTMLHTTPGTSMVLVDDLERGLHPSAQKSLVEVLRGFQREHPETQIVCTSHSPYIIDHFAAAEVCVTHVDSAGVCTTRSLASHPEWLEWKGKLDTGEFWSSVGEGWVAGGPT